MDYNQCVLKGLNESAASEIEQWEYKPPYDVYNFKGHPNGYLLNKETWGKEQFCLVCDDITIGYVSCQYANNDLWVGWSLSPAYCGKGRGYEFINKCITEIIKINKYHGVIYLKVAVWNKRAIQVYHKSGFVYHQTIKDEIAYTNHIEDFWIMIYKTV